MGRRIMVKLIHIDKLENGLESLFNVVYSNANAHKFYLKKDMKDFAQYTGFSSLVLDIGSRNSPYKSLFHFEKYMALDIDNEKPIDIIADICNLPIKSMVADLVICTEVLEHVYTPNIAVNELNRVLKNGKNLILTTPLLIGFHDQVDFFRFTDLGLKNILGEAGFEILEMRKNGGILSALGSLLKHTPNQVLSPIDKKNYLKVGLIFLFNLFLIPITRLLITLDVLDKNKNYTLGYSILAGKI